LIPCSLEDLIFEMADDGPPARRSEMEALLTQLAAAISGNNVRTPGGGKFTPLKENFTAADAQLLVRQYEDYLDGNSENGDCMCFGKRTPTGGLTRPSRELGDVYRVGLAGLKAALEQTHFGGDLNGLHPVEIIEKLIEPMKVSNESALFCIREHQLLNSIEISEEYPNSNALARRFKAAFTDMTAIQALARENPLSESQKEAVDAYVMQSLVLQYLLALQKRPEYRHMSDSILGAKIGAMTLEDCQSRFSGISLVSGFTPAEAASAFPTEAREGRHGRAARHAANVICYRCGSLGHTNRDQSCDKPKVSHQRLLDVHRAQGVSPPTWLVTAVRGGGERKQDQEAYTLDVFPDPVVLRRRVEAFASDLTPGDCCTVDTAARVHVCTSLDLLSPATVRPLATPLRLVWGGQHSMSATHVGDMKVQGLDVSHVYYVEGFKKNLLSTVALRKQYAFVQVDDEMLIHDLAEYKDKDSKVKREPLAVARYVEENMYAMNIMKPDPYSVPILYTTNVQNPDALLGYHLALGHVGIDKLKSMVEKGLIKGVKHAIRCDRACLCMDCQSSRPRGGGL